MKILVTAKRIPGGLMVVPLILGALVNTFCGGVWEKFDGTFTTYLWKSGAMPLLSAFIFCNATTISFRRAGVAVGKGILLTVVKVGIGIAAEDASVPDAHLTIARKPETRRVPTRSDAKF